MSRRVIEPIFTIIFIVVTIFNMFCLGVESFNYDMEALPKGQHIASGMSPDAKNTLRLYKVTVKDVGVAMRGEIASLNDDGSIVTKNIYWETNTNSPVPFGWLDEDTVVINQHIIDINGEPFDSRTQIELPEASAKNRSQNNF